ncbi:hypothetical protein BUALT_Bualt09G0079600 [Buddleja alternifolia]|uniref:Glycosyltransferase n=1 Tax=Buddleja alternifolia TaxID=168488 RepID=A0AAV6X9E0_9LAMI|nr:hypothetical protein BUALT_Bualt09G0079600 [Buddleja alternifolia]
MAERQHKLQAIMISVPFQGHINPFVNLALKLASKGCAITFVHLQHIHQKLSKAHNSDDLFSEARGSGLDIRYTTISDGLPLEFDRDLHAEEYWVHLFREFPAIVDDFVGTAIEADPYLVPFLVADTVYAWPAAVAEKYKLVNVSLWTEPALVFSLVYHEHLLKERGHIPCKDDQVQEINYVPGVESISTNDLMSYLSETDDILLETLSAAFKGVKKADFILHNIVHELESKTLSALNKYQLNYAIGPINFYKNLAANTISKSLVSESECAPWLASKPPGSVLYVSFGSIAQTSKHVIEEIAYGLLLSEVKFIWVVRAGIVSFDDDTNVLPEGFEDMIKDKGLIIPWCNQITVLSDPAVGGFLTHCGWNSTIESMWCGVPMICYPITYDQPTNRKLVVDNWKIGISLCDGKSVNRKEVAENIKSCMSGTCSKSLRQEAKKVKDILQNALEVDGSSDRNFDQFFNDLKAKINDTATSE